MLIYTFPDSVKPENKMRLVDSWVNCLYSKAGEKGSLLTCDVSFEGPVSFFCNSPLKFLFNHWCLCLHALFCHLSLPLPPSSMPHNRRLRGETEFEDVLHWEGKGTFNWRNKIHVCVPPPSQNWLWKLSLVLASYLSSTLSFTPAVE